MRTTRATPVRMTCEDLLERYSAGERRFAGVYLIGNNPTRNAVFRRVCLKHIDLSGAWLGNAIFEDVDLSYSRLVGAQLSYSHLTLVDLTDTDLTGAVMKWASLRYCSLVNSIMNDINLTSAVLEGTVLQAILERANFTDVDLSKADVSQDAANPTPEHLLYAPGALLWKTVLPNGRYVEGPCIHD